MSSRRRRWGLFTAGPQVVVSPEQASTLWHNAPLAAAPGIPLGPDPATQAAVGGDPVTWAREGVASRVGVVGRSDDLLARWVLGVPALGVRPVVIGGSRRLMEAVAAMGGLIVDVGRGADSINILEVPAHRMPVAVALITAATGTPPTVDEQQLLASAIGTLSTQWEQSQPPMLWDLIGALQRGPASASLVQTLQSIVHHYGDVIARPTTASLGDGSRGVGMRISGVNPKDGFLKAALSIACWSAVSEHLQTHDCMSVVAVDAVADQVPDMLDELLRMLRDSVSVVVTVLASAQSVVAGYPVRADGCGQDLIVAVAGRPTVRVDLRPTSTESDIAAGLVPAPVPALWPSEHDVGAVEEPVGIDWVKADGHLASWAGSESSDTSTHAQEPPVPVALPGTEATIPGAASDDNNDAQDARQTQPDVDDPGFRAATGNALSLLLPGPPADAPWPDRGLTTPDPVVTEEEAELDLLLAGLADLVADEPTVAPARADELPGTDAQHISTSDASESHEAHDSSPGRARAAGHLPPTDDPPHDACGAAAPLPLDVSVEPAPDGRAAPTGTAGFRQTDALGDQPTAGTQTDDACPGGGETVASVVGTTARIEPRDDDGPHNRRVDSDAPESPGSTPAEHDAQTPAGVLPLETRTPLTDVVEASGPPTEAALDADLPATGGLTPTTGPDAQDTADADAFATSTAVAPTTSEPDDQAETADTALPVANSQEKDDRAPTATDEAVEPTATGADPPDAEHLAPTTDPDDQPSAQDSVEPDSLSTSTAVGPTTEADTFATYAGPGDLLSTGPAALATLESIEQAPSPPATRPASELDPPEALPPTEQPTGLPQRSCATLVADVTTSDTPDRHDPLPETEFLPLDDGRTDVDEPSLAHATAAPHTTGFQDPPSVEAAEAATEAETFGTGQTRTDELPPAHADVRLSAMETIDELPALEQAEPTTSHGAGADGGIPGNAPSQPETVPTGQLRAHLADAPGHTDDEPEPADTVDASETATPDTTDAGGTGTDQSGDPLEPEYPVPVTSGTPDEAPAHLNAPDTLESTTGTHSLETTPAGPADLEQTTDPVAATDDPPATQGLPEPDPGLAQAEPAASEVVPTPQSASHGIRAQPQPAASAGDRDGSHETVGDATDGLMEDDRVTPPEVALGTGAAASGDRVASPRDVDWIVARAPVEYTTDPAEYAESETSGGDAPTSVPEDGETPEPVGDDSEPTGTTDARASRRNVIVLVGSGAAAAALIAVWAVARPSTPASVAMDASAGGGLAPATRAEAVPGASLALAAPLPIDPGGLVAAERRAPATRPGAGLIAAGEVPEPALGGDLIAATTAARPLPRFGVSRVAWSAAASWQKAQLPVVTQIPLSPPGTTVTVPQYPQPANPQVAPPQSGQGSSTGSGPSNGTSGGVAQPAPGAPPPNQPFNPQNPDSPS